MSFNNNEDLNISFSNELNENDTSDNDSNSDSDTSEIDTNEEKPQFENNTITIFGEQKGKRSNTYIAGLKVDETTRKEYLKKLKGKHGCGGSIKDIVYNDVEQTVIQLQGDQIVNAHSFLKDLKLTQKIITKSF